MEIKIGDIKLTAEDGVRKNIAGDRETFIYIEVLGTFDSEVKPVPKVLSKDLKAAIEVLEQTCCRY